MVIFYHLVHPERCFISHAMVGGVELPMGVLVHMVLYSYTYT